MKTFLPAIMKWPLPSIRARPDPSGAGVGAMAGRATSPTVSGPSSPAGGLEQAVAKAAIIGTKTNFRPEDRSLVIGVPPVWISRSRNYRQEDESAHSVRQEK